MVPTISIRYSINKLGAKVKTAWYPWYIQGEVEFWNLSSIHCCLRGYLVSDGIWLNFGDTNIHFSGIKVGGYVVGYQNLTFVTIRGAGHMVPSSQPARALAFFSSFLDGKLPPAAKS